VSASRRNDNCFARARMGLCVPFGMAVMTASTITPLPLSVWQHYERVCYFHGMIPLFYYTIRSCKVFQGVK